MNKYTYNDMISSFCSGLIVAVAIGFLSCCMVNYCTNNWWEKEMITRNIGCYDKEHKFQFKNCQEISNEILDKWKATK